MEQDLTSIALFKVVTRQTRWKLFLRTLVFFFLRTAPFCWSCTWDQVVDVKTAVSLSIAAGVNFTTTAGLMS